MRGAAVSVAALVLAAAGAAAVTQFVSLGDWGEVTAAQGNVARSMAATLRAGNYSFLMNLGDNFYPAGVETDTDPQWKATYERPYADPAFNIPWYMTLGNHDHMPSSGGQAEIDYFTKGLDPNKRWYLPSFWYTKTFALDNGQTLQILFLDTILLCPQCTVKTLTRFVADGEFTQNGLDQYKANLAHWQTVASAEWAWLNATLAASTADWTMACGHYPIYSGGEHGSQIELITELEPILQSFGLDAYINGHDHTLQHLQNAGLNFFVSGGGTKLGTYTPQRQSVWGKAENGYMTHTFNAVDQLTTEVFDEHGNSQYKYTQTRRTKPWER